VFDFLVATGAPERSFDEWGYPSIVPALRRRFSCIKDRRAVVFNRSTEVDEDFAADDTVEDSNKTEGSDVSGVMDRRAVRTHSRGCNTQTVQMVRLENWGQYGSGSAYWSGENQHNIRQR
jgi:hypothetical protein